jgi:hypothetical protein
MKLRRRIRNAALAGLAATAALGAPAVARAGGMDPTPERLVLQPPGLPAGQTCQSIAANPELAVAGGSLPNALACQPNNLAFRNMIAELGFAIAPTAFYPARTTGVGGFALTLEATYTKIHADERVQDGSPGVNGAPGGTQYWHEGTRGSIDTATKQFSIRNNSPDSMLQVYSIRARKGLPYGFELGGSLGFVGNTSLWVGGGDLRWSVMEGFRTGWPSYIPDVSVGGGVRTLTGTSKFHLTTASVDVKLSKPFTAADSAVITPSLGYQRLIIFGDSTIVDATPNVDAMQQCGYDGPNPESGAPVCRNKLSTGVDNNGDFNNNFTFDKVRVHRHRMSLGLSYRYDIFYLAGQTLFDLTSPDDENPGLSSSRQWQLSFETGLFF